MTRTPLSLAVACLLALAACDGPGTGTRDVPDDPGALPDPWSGDPLPPWDPGDPADPATADPGGGELPGDVPDVPPDACTPACEGRVCGDDGCGGTCGTCPPLCEGTEPGPCDQGRCAMACCPFCGDRVCGPDGCAGLCGTCGDGQACDAMNGTCVPVCDWDTGKPTAWGPAGQGFGLACSADIVFNEARCQDFTGDGKGDNGMRTMCNQVNGTLVPVDPAPVPLVAVLEGVVDVLQAPRFTLAVLPVLKDPQPPLSAGDVLATSAGYDTSSCLPRYGFPGATITDGVLSAGPVDLVLRLVLGQGVPELPLRVVQARLSGRVQPGGGAAGFALEEGVFTGVVTRQAWQEVIDTMQAECDAAPGDAQPDWCPYLKVAVSSLPLMMDLHQAGDGTFVAKGAGLPADAGSICWTFRLIPARVAGFAP